MLDLTAIVQPTLAVIGLVLAGLFAAYVPKMLTAFQTRTGIMLSAQQSAAILGFVQTSAGVIETKLDQGALQVAHVNVSNPTILAEAQSILAAAPVAAAGLGMTVPGVAKMIVGAVDTGTRSTTTTEITASPSVVAAAASIAAPVAAAAPVPVV